MKMIEVIAKAGCVCPRENPREPIITDVTSVMIPENAYYTRLMQDGSLVRIPTAVSAVEAIKTDGTTGKKPSKKGGVE